jgi:hypothetical protein
MGNSITMTSQGRVGPTAFGQRSRRKQTLSEPIRSDMCSLCSEPAIVFKKHEIVGKAIDDGPSFLLSACTLRDGFLRLSIIPVPAASGPNPFGAEGAEAAWGGARHLLAQTCRFADCVLRSPTRIRSHESKADQEASGNTLLSALFHHKTMLLPRTGGQAAPADVSSLGGLPA